jgi:ribulose-bisphosphate carboxylase large chain
LQMANDICIEQTIEFPIDLVQNEFILNQVVGHLESFEKIGDCSYKAKISFHVDVAAFELTQVLNVIFGNISLKPGIVASEIELPDTLLQYFKGPRFGLEGIRRILNVYDRPLLGTALKPLGLSAKELGNLAYQFAKGGIDIIKDDHGLADQAYAPFQERVKYCAEAVQKANAETGSASIYVPNVTSSFTNILPRVYFAQQTGARGLLLAPGLVGFDTLRAISADESVHLPILSHPSFLGCFLSPAGGFSHYALLGQLMRLAGADAVIFPNYGGRFPFTRVECENIVKGLKVDLGRIKKIFPMPGGGIQIEMLPELSRIYGKDVIYLIGGDLFRHSQDLIESCRYFHDMVVKYKDQPDLTFSPA